MVTLGICRLKITNLIVSFPPLKLFTFSYMYVNKQREKTNSCITNLHSFADTSLLKHILQYQEGRLCP